MSFIFNWNQPPPEFYDNAKRLLSEAMNYSTSNKRSFQSEIVVEDLSLGSKPPDIEVLEIGDGAGDAGNVDGWFNGTEYYGEQTKFRGVFRVRYDGDGWIRLRTKVQANPLCTTLEKTPGFASPQPLFAAAPLAMPLTTTLSEIKLSGLVILTFSKTTGVTLVFRNDPLESLVVDSPFSHIPGIQDYLQREVESSVRTLFLDELPLAVYRLSLRHFSPHQPFLTPSQPDVSPEQPLFKPRPKTAQHMGADDDDDEEKEWGEDGIFSTPQKSVGLTILLDTQRTISLFTPTIQNCLYRAKMPSLTPPSRPQLRLGIPESLGQEEAVGSSMSTRPATPMGRPRKVKRRVIDLRGEKTGGVEEGTKSEPLKSARVVKKVETWSSETKSPVHSEVYGGPRLIRQRKGERETGEKGVLRRAERERENWERWEHLPRYQEKN